MKFVWLAGCLVVAGCSSSAPSAASTDTGGEASTSDPSADADAEAGTSDSSADSANAEASAPDSADDAGCGGEFILFFNTPGCGNAGLCLPRNTPVDACGPGQFCGCDGVTFEGGCGYAHRPYASVGACPASVDDAMSDTDVGCVARTWSVAGCDQTSNGCQDTPDACTGISTWCGCDGATFQGGCGFASKPFRSAGACPDAAP